MRKTAAVAVRISKGGVAGCDRQHFGVLEQAPREEQLQGEMGGAVVLEVSGGVRVWAVTEGARHAPVDGGTILGA